ncbi:MAG: GNAT family N-acetyltransferase [Gammaproteobacteria bacterium]
MSPTPDKPNLQPTLDGTLVLIRPIAEADRDPMYAAASDPGIWTQHPATNRHERPVFDQYFDGALSSGGGLTFIERTSGEIIGSSRYYGFDEATREVEIGWTFLARPFWGGRYNGEIKALMVAHAFTFASTVVFWVAQENHRSRKAVEKIGAIVRDGVHHRRISGDAPYLIYQLRP